MIVSDETDFALNYGNADARKAVSSRRALAKLLGCSETTVSRMSIAPGNPGTNLNGSYPLQKWRDFFEEWKNRNKDDDGGELSLEPGAGSELKKEQLALMRAKRQKAELDLEARRGELVELSKIEDAAFTFSARLCATHKRSATVDLFNKLCDTFPVDDAAALLEVLENFHEDFCRKTQEMKESLEKD